MINRELIRLKTVQIIYSYYINETGENKSLSMDACEKELHFSLDKAYELYHALLMLLVELKQVATEDIEFREMRNRQLGVSARIDRRLANNRLLAMLAENEQLREFTDANNQFWALDIKMIENMYKAFIQSAEYASYLEQEDNFENDCQIIRRFYRNMVCDNEDINAVLEDKSIYWNDDKFIVDTFVLKTLKTFKEDSAANMPLLPQYQHNEDLEYAVSLLRHSINNDQYYRSLVEKQAKGWDMRRIALMDLVILQTALAEIISFPSIPIPVSINEYINIAKMYSPQKNWTFVNATLDNIARQLEAEHKIITKC